MDNNFVIYRSSAGSGKTFTLVQEYLHLALPHSGFKDILAITFTNKAACEMKTRILSELAEMKRGMDLDNNQMAKMLCDRLGYSYNTLASKAQRLESEILHNYADFAICTIDSFMQKVIRTFAYDLSLPLNYEVLLDTEHLKQRAIDDLLQQIGIDDDFTDIILSYAHNQMEQGKSWTMEQQLHSLADEIFSEEAPKYLQQLKEISLKNFVEIHKSLTEKNRAYELFFRAEGERIMKALDDEGLCETDFYHGASGVGAYFKALSVGQMKERNSYVQSFPDKRYGAKASSEIKEKIDGLVDVMSQSLNAIEEYEAKHYSAYCTRRLLLEKLFTVAVLNAISERVDVYSNDNELLHISEFNKRIADIVLTEPVPFIYERLGERYNHFLIDEFQDTSVLQWQNLLPLVSNSLSKGGYSLVVGDGKQAIYRFRQGEVEQFMRLPEVYNPMGNMNVAERAIMLKSSGVVKELNTNYRTRATIVEFNNDFFTKLMNCDDLLGNEKIRDIYLGKSYIESSGDADVKPSLYQKSVKGGGYVCMQMIEDKDDDVAKGEKMLQHIYSTIAMLVGEKGYAYRDIAILARTKAELNTVSVYLSEQSIGGERVPLLSSESFLLMKNSEVVFLMSLLRCLLNASDTVSQMVVLEYLHQHNLLKGSHIEFFSKKEEERNVFDFLSQNGYEMRETELLSTTLYDCCESLVRLFSLRDRNADYVASFLNVVSTYSVKNRQSVSDFIEWMDENGGRLSVQTSADLNAITLMTIHKSKGLEFPVVLYPIMSDGGRHQSDNMWVEIDEGEKDNLLLPVGLVSSKKDMEKTIFQESYTDENKKKDLDDINVLYVALTRAKDKLYIYVPRKEKSSGIPLYMNEFYEVMNGGNDDSCVLEFGDNVGADDRKEEALSKSKIELTELQSEAWDEKILIAPERATQATKGGLLVHEVLSYIIRTSDVEHALMRVKNRLSSAEYEELKTKVEGFVFGADTARFFNTDCRVMTECEIVYEGAFYRPDRVLFLHDETWIVDFKTGAPLENHKKQIEQYKQILMDMGYPKVSGFLLYC